MCQPGESQRVQINLGTNCGCGHFFRRFLSAKEEKERLEEYKNQLKKELDAAEECIQQKCE